jgi:hypothetical protein
MAVCQQGGRVVHRQTPQEIAGLSEPDGLWSAERYVNREEPVVHSPASLRRQREALRLSDRR